MRILVVNWQDRDNPRAGGAETHLHEIFGRLAGWGHEVALLCSGAPGLPRRARLDGIEVHRVGGRHTFFLQARSYARGRLAEPPFDVLVEDLNKVPLFTPRWGLAPVVPLVHHLFGRVAFQEAAFPIALATWLLELTIPPLYRGLPTIAVSESTRRDLARRGLRAGDIEVIPNGVAPGLLASPPPERRFPDPTVLYLGRLQRYKRVDLVLRAVARIRARGLQVHLRVAGKGHDAGRLRALVSRLGIEDAVEFLGFVSEADKEELLGRSWVHVLTSPKEGWGITNLEAAARGTPTVASDSEGLRDSVVDGQTGFLVPHGDVEALADRLEALLRDPDLRSGMGDAARAFAEGFTWESSARRVEAMLRNRVAEAPSRN